MIEVAQATVTIIPTMKGSQAKITKDLAGMTDPAGASAGESTGDKFSSKFGDGIKKSAKAIGDAVKTTALAASAAVVAIVKEATDSYAQYEQLVGGVDTLFKDSSKTVQENAQQAFKTAGMSANDYMETVTSFSASLLQSMGGDTEAAAAVADMALRDMSDNANKFGSDMEGIQAAYQGFAKQNYTMLDNLKLGYGGTKQEMERLLEDATKISGVKYDIKNLDDVYNAIHVIQENLGVTGTTAEEAMTTISGAAGATKAAWENLLTSIAGGGDDIKTSVDNLMSAVFGGEAGGGLLNNIIPVIETAIKGVGEFIAEAAPQIVPKIGELITSILPDFIAATLSVIDSIAQQLPTLITEIGAMLPDILAKGKEIVENLLGGFSENAPQIIEAMKGVMGDLITIVGDAITDIITALGPYVPELTTLVTETAALLPDIIAAFDGLVKDVGTAITNIVSALAPYIPDITNMVTTTVQEIPKIVDSFKGLLDSIGPIIDSIGGVIEKIGTAVTGIVDSIGTNLALIVDAFVGLNSSLAEPIKSLGDAISGVVTAVGDAIVGINNSVAGILDSVSGIFTAMGDAAIKAGEGFGTVADAAIKLANETSLVDLVASLGAVAGGIKDINHEAGWAADHKIGDALAGVGKGLASLKTDGEGIDTLGAGITTLSESIKALNNEVKGDAKTNVASLGTEINKMISNAGRDFTTFGKTFDDAVRKVKDMVASSKTSIKDLTNNIKAKITEATSSIKTESEKWSGVVSNAITSVKNLFGGGFSWGVPELPALSDPKWSTTATNAINAVKNLFGSGFSWGVPAMTELKPKWGDEIKAAIKAVKEQFPNDFKWSDIIPELKIPIKTPKFKVTGDWTFDDETGKIKTVPKITVEWYRKAAQYGALFSQPAIIGVGDASEPEMLLGEGTLYNNIRRAVLEAGGGVSQTLNITAPQGLDAKETARLVRNNTRQMLARMRGAV